jgi:transcriptional regulator with XRE-family HTH domain
MTKLKDMRLYRGLSQQELAEAAGLNIGTLRHYEQGSKLIDNAKLETILKCALALECNYTKLLESKETISLIYETFKNARY